MFKNIEIKSLYRWLVVFIAFYGMCLHAGCLIYASGLFIKPPSDIFRLGTRNNRTGIYPAVYFPGTAFTIYRKGR